MNKESELKRNNAIKMLEKSIECLRVGYDAKAEYEIEGAFLMVSSLVKERQIEAAWNNKS